MGIGNVASAFELVDVSFYKEVQLSLTRIFECFSCFRKFMAKLMTFFKKGEGGSPPSPAR